MQGRKLGFEFAAALVLGRELDEQTRDSLSVHFSNVINSFFSIPVRLLATQPSSHPLAAVTGLLVNVACLCNGAAVPDNGFPI